MLPTPPRERLSLPALPSPPSRPPFPLTATLAPVVVSLGIWAFTGSPYSLLFAVLGPVVAVGSLFDGRRQRRRAAGRDLQAALEAVNRTAAKVEAMHGTERARRRRLAPPPDTESARGIWLGSDGPLPVLLGHADQASWVELADDAVDVDAAPALREAVTRLRGTASVFPDAPWVTDARDGVAVLGPTVPARAVARSVAFQVLAGCSPRTATVQAPSDERWALALPHAVSVGEPQRYVIDPGSEAGPSSALVIAWALHCRDLPSGVGAVIELDADRPGSAWPGGRRDGPDEPRRVRPTALGSVRAEQLARLLAEAARAQGVVASVHALPRRLALRELLDHPAGIVEAASLRAPIGQAVDGVVEIDLVRDGPHAVVAGTTGTGKSELLVSWILAMATRHPPSAVTFLLVDFKGGAAFAPLAGVPHVVGIVSDLDARRSRRAIESLRAELRRREALLAERGARSLEELHGELPRLVIVVDEFAAVVSGQPELHEVFADLAARGRSLGLHLVLCTQRPAGVIRDGVLANITLRLSLRVTDRGDSIAMLGSEAASLLPPEPRGRAVMADGSGRVRELQLAIAEAADATRVHEGPSPSTGVWCEPLPEVIPLSQLEREAAAERSTGALDGDGHALGRAEGLALGRLDLPAEQRQPIARDDPDDGHVLILGTARSGKTNALALFARAAGSHLFPSDPADAWSLVDALATRAPEAAAEREEGPSGPPRLLLIDDLDVLLDRFEPELRHEFLERLERLARVSRGRRLIVAAQRLTGPLQRMTGLFGSRLLLRQPSRDEHVLAGGEGSDFDPQLSPGSGTWRGQVVQLALADTPLPTAGVPPLPRVPIGETLAVVAARPRDLRAALTASGTRLVIVGEDPAPLEFAGSHPPTILLGDPDAWQAEWTLLSLARRELTIVVVGCTASELRAIARTREVPPPLGGGVGECWLIESGVVRRAILEL